MRTTKATGPQVFFCVALISQSVAEIDDKERMGFPQAKPHSGSKHRGLISSSDDNPISSSTMTPMVGVGFLPLADSGDVLPSASDDELVEYLEDDDRITVQSLQLGELLCESLVNAEDAPVLAFAVGPNETFIANQHSFTVLNGSIFDDGISRKVWTGEEVVDDETAAAPCRAVSMTWGEVCDVETFILEIARRFSNGTLIVSKTIPCEAGGPVDICFVEMELRFPDEDDSDEVEMEVDPSGEVRRLGDSHLSYVAEKGHTYEVEAGASTWRQLQESTTQIDLMFLYTPGGRDILGVSDSQMQSELADSLIAVNEAMVNSDIDLQFSLVRVEPLPYEEESTTSSVVLDNLRDNTDVAELRDFYGADLVHLVADLDADSRGSCGRAILPFSPFEQFAFGVVDPYCFFQFSHTHEIAHNMGCFHNREDSGTQHPYAHGYRYCDGDLPYRTIMSYACSDVTGNVLPVNRVNYFSNPNVTFDDKPTGTSTDNCARRILETKDRVADYRNQTPITPPPTRAPTPAPVIDPTPVPFSDPTPVPFSDPTPVPVSAPTPAPVSAPTPAPVVTPTSRPIIASTPAPMTPPTPVPTRAPDACSNGIVGVERGIFCCTLGCGTCGGTDCGLQGRDEGLTAEDCCTSRISESGVFCDSSGVAPCIIGEAPTPRPITASTPAPMITPTPVPTRAPDACSNGIVGVEKGIFCCTLGCGICGGTGCAWRGRDEGLTAEDCCTSRISESGVYCDSSGNAPCIIGEASPSTPTPGPTIPGLSSPTLMQNVFSPEPTPWTVPVVFPTPEPTPLTEEFIEVGGLTMVSVSANGYHRRTSGSGCFPNGCVAANTRDGSLSTRWSCKEGLIDGVNCEINYEFDSPQDIDVMRIAFYKGSERTRRLKVKINGSTNSEIVSSGQTDQFEDFNLNVAKVGKVSLESLGLGSDDWIALSEVQFVLP